MRRRRWSGRFAGNDVVQLIPYHVVMNIVLMENLGRDVVIIPQQGQQQMLCTNNIGFVEFCLKIGDLENLFGLFCQRNIADGKRSA